MVDSSADVDGKFADGFFAYAYMGGPFVMMTYDNNGWGSDRMNMVATHEVGHIFYALDEYPDSSSYFYHSGYFNTHNLNASDNHHDPSSRVDSIMAESNAQINAYPFYISSPSSFEMVGWKDSDGDGVFDMLDVPLTLNSNGAFDANTNTYSFTDTSNVNTLANSNPNGLGNAITLNTVDRIQYLVNGGSLVGGASYGGSNENVAQSVVVTVAGNHTIDFRTMDDDSGVTSNLFSGTLNVQGAPPTITVTPIDQTTDESGATGSFSVVLDTQPTADVVIAITSSNTSEGTISTTSLTFISSNWNQP